MFGAIPNMFGAVPDVFGAVPDVFGAIPNMFGAVPDMFGAMENLSNGKPNRLAVTANRWESAAAVAGMPRGVGGRAEPAFDFQDCQVRVKIA